MRSCSPLRARGDLLVALILVSGSVGACGRSSDSGTVAGNGGAAPGTRPLAAFQPGSRLHAQVQRGEGGTPVLVGWFDTQLGITCQFAVAEDGQWRCLPRQSNVSRGFADAACTQPALVIRSSCGESPAYIAEENIAPAVTAPVCQSDPSPARVVKVTKVGATLPGPGYNADCTPVPSAQNFAVHAVGGAAEPELFLKAQLAVEAAGPRLTARILVAEDGARQIVGYVDKQTDNLCPISPSGGHCLPPRIASHRYEALLQGGNICGRKVAAGDDVSCPAAEAIIVHTQEECGGVHQELHTVGARVPASEVGFGVGSEFCVPSGSAMTAYYDIGPRIPDGTYVSLAPAPRGPGPLQVLHQMASDGSVLPPLGYYESTSSGPVFYDSTRGIPCIPWRMPSGALRCLPDGPTTAQLNVPDELPVPAFADSQCQTPIIGRLLGQANPNCPSGPSLAPTLGITRNPDLGCGPPRLVSLRRLSQVSPATIFFKLDNASCLPQGPESGFEPDPNIVWFLPGDPIPEADFPLVEEVTLLE